MPNPSVNLTRYGGQVTSNGQADANKGHDFAMVMALVGTLRTFGAPAPLTSAID